MDTSNGNIVPSNNKAKKTFSGRGGWRPYNRRFGSNNNGIPKEKPVVFQIPENRNNVTNKQTFVSMVIDNTPTKYPGWKLYHPKEDYSDSSITIRKVRAMEEFIKENYLPSDIVKIRITLWFAVKIQFLLEDAKFTSSWINFQQDLLENPEFTLNCLGLAMHQRISLDTVMNSQMQNSINPMQCFQTVRARILGYSPIVNLRSLKVNSYGKLTAIRGTVIRANVSQIQSTWLAFKCSICNMQQAIRQPDGIFVEPTSCQKGCRIRSNFIPLLDSPFTRSESYQTIRLQESMQGDQYDSGRVPRSIEVELNQDLVDSVCPGDDVTVTGILKVRPQEENYRKGVANMYKMYLQGVAIVSNKNLMASRKSEFTDKDLQAINLIKSEPDIFRLLIHSLCPTIYGHEMVKAGLILGLFGGAGNITGRRTETHVLVVGDPGVGKSQMLQACSNVSPRGIFVCGNSSSNAGLTVTVRHEKGTGGSLEAGALVLADQGACCIDEFDKMSANHQALLEVMEQQTVSVAKAGVLCSLPARTCILAAANPSGGHYDKSKTVSENLKLSPALLSRFDLVFILLDNADENLDSLLTSHIQTLHSSTHHINTSTNSYIESKNKKCNNFDNANYNEKLCERLKLLPNENIDLLPHVLMQKYIGYARKNINPILSNEAAEALKVFYLNLRKVRQGFDSIPITTRQLEALIRLTQARARLDLCEEVTLKHAKDVLDIVKHSLADVFSTDTGVLQMERNINGSGMSQRAQIKKFLHNLQIKSKTLNKTVFSTDELKEILLYTGTQINLINLIDTLNIQGFLLKKGRNLYKLLNE